MGAVLPVFGAHAVDVLGNDTDAVAIDRVAVPIAGCGVVLTYDIADGSSVVLRPAFL
jgi:hypothetical protein